MKNICIFFLILFQISIQGQDGYHEELISSLQSEYGLDSPQFVLSNTEADNINNMYSYGALLVETNDISDFDFTKQTTFNITSEGSNVWDTGAGFKNLTSINKDDIILVTFWAKKNGSNSEIFFFIEDGISFEKEFYESFSLTPDWNQYFIAINASKGFSIDRMAMGFHLAAQVQSFELGGFTALNFGQIDLDNVPSSFSPGMYEGMESDAGWRITAQERIESIRKADLDLTIKDSAGNLISDAIVKVEMQEHEFGFGSALVTCRFPGNDCHNTTYVEKISNLDGNGHGFNVGVTENALKWDGWEEEWIGSPDETVAAIQYLSENGVKMRGHTLFWPGYNMMPDDILQNKNDLNYLRNRISGRINEMIDHPVLSELIEDWDVLNEITQNRDLELAFKNDPNFTTGREIYTEIFDQIRTIDPNVKLYVNDYVVLSGGGTGSNVTNRYKEYLDEISDGEAGLDGIGFQCHIGSNPTSIPKMEAVFDEFYNRYGKPMKVTEYDISEMVDPDIQASYMKDILTITYSHPAMEAFIMWGFWDGNHWKGNAPMFDMNWNLKPSGVAFNEKVFNEWWTTEEFTTNSEGNVFLRGFKGKYKITVTKGDSSQEFDLTLYNDEDIEVTFDITNTVSETKFSEIVIKPNIVSSRKFLIEFPGNRKVDFLEIFNLNGSTIKKIRVTNSNQVINFSGDSGIYFVKCLGDWGSEIRKIIVQ